MRFLLIPVISTRVDVHKESDFLVYLQLAKIKQEHFFHIVLSKDANVPEDMNLPNVAYHYIEEWYPFSAGQSLLTDKLYQKFNPVCGEIQVDAVITSRTCIAASLKKMFWWSQETYVPVFILEPKVCEIGGTHDMVSELDLRLRALSYVECPTFFSTTRERDLAFQGAKRYLSPNLLSQFIDKAMVRSQGFPAQMVSDIAAVTPKRLRPTLLFSARFNSNKRWSEVLNLFQTLVRSGKDLDVIANGWSGILSEEQKAHFDTVTFQEPLPYKDYLEMLASCHIGMSASHEEGFAVGWAEQVATGNPILFPKRDWVDALVGSDYPFIYKSADDGYALLCWVLKNYEQAVEMMQPIKSRFIAMHDVSVAADDIFGKIISLIPQSYAVFDEFRAKLDETFTEDMPNSFTLRHFISTVAKKHKVTVGSYLRGISISAYRNFYYYLSGKCNASIEVEQLFFKKP